MSTFMYSKVNEFVQHDYYGNIQFVKIKLIMEVLPHEFELRSMKFVSCDSFGDTIFRQILAWRFTFVNSKVHVVMIRTEILEKYEDPPLNLTISGV